MGFRYRRSLRVAPGLRLNLSKSGISASVGRPDLTVNFGRRSRATLGIPGTGLSYTSYSKSGRTRPGRRASSAAGEVTSASRLNGIAAVFGLILLVFSDLKWQGGLVFVGALTVAAGRTYWKIAKRKRTEESVLACSTPERAAPMDNLMPGHTPKSDRCLTQQMNADGPYRSGP
jgi:uncharacterized protein DUF4236